MKRGRVVERVVRTSLGGELALEGVVRVDGWLTLGLGGRGLLRWR